MSHQTDLYTFKPADLVMNDSDDGQTLAPPSNMPLSDTMTLEIPANLQYVNVLGIAVRAFLEHVSCLAEPEVTLYNLELAIYEIGANIVNHAYGDTCGKIHLSATLSDQPLRVIVVLSDTGQTFDPADVPEPRLGELQEHGYGLFLVKELMDEVVYQQTDTGNLWKLIKNLPTIVPA